MGDAQRLIAAFLSGRKASTIWGYRKDLNDFSRFTRASDPATAAGLLLAAGAGLGNSLVLDYRNDMVSKGLSPATINDSARLAGMCRRSPRRSRDCGCEKPLYRVARNPFVCH